MTPEPLLSVRGLRVDYATPTGVNPALRGVDLDIARGEVVAVVGESGSGKSTIAHALVRLLPQEATIVGGDIRFDDVEIMSLSQRALRRVRGARIGFVPQDPSHSLNPVLRIGEQIAEVIRRHGGLTPPAAAARAIEILDEVGVPEPAQRARQYPHELSGGLRQRVLIGIAWACNPELVIADEPTSALDATVQRHVLDRMQKMREAHGTSVLLVTHDLGVAADRADRIVVVNKGEIVERGTSAEVLADPTHEYTRRLVAAAPGLRSHRLEPTSGARRAADAVEPFLRVAGLSKTYGSSAAPIVAADALDFSIARGTTFAIVGESGSGKSTTARMVARIVDADAGTVLFDGADITRLRGAALRQLRRRLQVVYQNPFGSLDPRMKIGAIIDEPLRAFGMGSRAQRATAVRDLMADVRLDPALADRRPAQLSGGQRQRVAIARALALRPEMIILDEPVSALDVSVQEQVLQLLVDLQAEHGLTYLFISHDLGVIRQISDEVAVMRRGVILEQGTAEHIFADPRHDYTRELLSAIPGGGVSAG
ncbi:ABC transporter ATP-binding protein [Microbacterium sp. SSW1-59]|uniref:ABC transporter ATP-binding protein n=1 Tax=Microbacterium xanthum TaxID=3079794 RepID=UPI002AD39FAF|nr:ABC transporter ATP-binding protein [Microbacterium sp. SSW1-59]MDZ8200438.1 ABC transporter ATP-binding protein [Microbacterium sp. SSW1-59]